MASKPVRHTARSIETGFITEYPGDAFFVEGPASNWVIVRAADTFTLIDSGYPADRERVLGSIRALGLKPEKAAALLITHGHVDHTGSAAHFSEVYGVPVLCSPAELDHVAGKVKHQVTLGQAVAAIPRNLRVLPWMIHAIRAGALKATPAVNAKAWTPEILRELPGQPEAVVSSAHTPGHASYLLPDASAVVTGDLLVTGHPLSRRLGPQLLDPIFHHHPGQAASALQALAGLDATFILPGHGPAYTADLTEAIAAATNFAQGSIQE